MKITWPIFFNILFVFVSLSPEALSQTDSELITQIQESETLEQAMGYLNRMQDVNALNNNGLDVLTAIASNPHLRSIHPQDMELAEASAETWRSTPVSSRVAIVIERAVRRLLNQDQESVPRQRGLPVDPFYELTQRAMRRGYFEKQNVPILRRAIYANRWHMARLLLEKNYEFKFHEIGLALSKPFPQSFIKDMLARYPGQQPTIENLVNDRWINSALENGHSDLLHQWYDAGLIPRDLEVQSHDGLNRYSIFRLAASSYGYQSGNSSFIISMIRDGADLIDARSVKNHSTIYTSRAAPAWQSVFSTSSSLESRLPILDALLERSDIDLTVKANNSNVQAIFLRPSSPKWLDAFRERGLRPTSVDIRHLMTQVMSYKSSESQSPVPVSNVKEWEYAVIRTLMANPEILANDSLDLIMNFAVRHNYSEIVFYLADKEGYQLSQITRQRALETLFHEGLINEVRFLDIADILRRDWNPGDFTNQASNPLHALAKALEFRHADNRALSNRSTDLAEILVTELKIDPNKKDEYSKTPLEYALINKNESLSQYLLSLSETRVGVEHIIAAGQGNRSPALIMGLFSQVEAIGPLRSDHFLNKYLDIAIQTNSIGMIEGLLKYKVIALQHIHQNELFVFKMMESITSRQALDYVKLLRKFHFDFATTSPSGQTILGIVQDRQEKNWDMDFQLKALAQKRGQAVISFLNQKPGSCSFISSF